MKNLTLKFAKDAGYVSERIQQLMDEQLYPDEEFEDNDIEEIYKNAKYYHKAQHGLIRISKYVFSDTADLQRKCLNKHNINTEVVDYFYDFGLTGSSKPDAKIWYVNSASDKAFRTWGTNTKSQEVAMVQKMPLLHKVSLFLDTNIQPTVCFRNANKIWTPSPILFEGVPLWLSTYTGELKYISWDHTCNIAAMMAPFGGNGAYTETQILFLLTTLFAAFGGIVRRAQKDRCDYVELHSSSWGCGNFRNNKELIYLSQIYAADVMGIKKIIFHKIDEKSLQAALEKYSVIPDQFSFLDAVNHFTALGFTWP